MCDDSYTKYINSKLQTYTVIYLFIRSAGVVTDVSR